MTLQHQLGGGDVVTILEPGQFPPPRDGAPVPAQSIVDTLRGCEPTRELLGLLSRESIKAAGEKRVGDAAALLLFALCVKQALGEPCSKQSL